MREVTGEGRSGCPVDHLALSQRKTVRVAEPAERRLVEHGADGVWHVRGHASVREVLRSPDAKQAGFNAELLERMPQGMRPPILYQEGKPHNEQRKQTARFFSPKTVSENYRGLMEEFAGELVEELRRKRRVELDVLSFRLAVKVAGKVVGLTDSRLPGMDWRLENFFENDGTQFGWSPRELLSFAKSQARTAAFFYLDVKPAIEVRKKELREDVISHLLSLGYGDGEILTECLTYAAAGMVTTREFISVAAWHMLAHAGTAGSPQPLPEKHRRGTARATAEDPAPRIRRRQPLPARYRRHPVRTGRGRPPDHSIREPHKSTRLRGQRRRNGN